MTLAEVTVCELLKRSGAERTSHPPADRQHMSSRIGQFRGVDTGRAPRGTNRVSVCARTRRCAPWSGAKWCGDC